MIHPFQNEAEVATIGELTVENRLDRIELYGALTLTKDQAGLRLALALKELIDATVAALRQADLPEHITPAASDQVPNPFTPAASDQVPNPFRSS
ncbi:MAG TPA: hypothetical protein VEC06_02840 [Paucimonas sp.]|nr:hypothetical protein [Paucimonas sp.]